MEAYESYRQQYHQWPDFAHVMAAPRVDDWCNAYALKLFTTELGKAGLSRQETGTGLPNYLSVSALPVSVRVR